MNREIGKVLHVKLCELYRCVFELEDNPVLGFLLTTNYITHLAHVPGCYKCVKAGYMRALRDRYWLTPRPPARILWPYIEPKNDPLGLL